MTLHQSELIALREAVESGEGFRNAAETERVARWSLAEIERLRMSVSRLQRQVRLADAREIDHVRTIERLRSVAPDAK